MATYVIGDVHNSLENLDRVLELISPKAEDSLYFLGDLFDRGGANPDPVGVYFRVLGIPAKWTWIRGNHDQMLADYICRYYAAPERKRTRMEPYPYNTFELMKNRLVKVDMLRLADTISKLPLQAEVKVGSVKYLLAHAMTTDPGRGEQPKEIYLKGSYPMEEYFRDGIDGYISMVGHMDSSYMQSASGGEYLSGDKNSVWRNEKKNLYFIDCGCGLPYGRLACMCLETGEIYYG